jgi:hypothetical protein
MFKKMFNKYNDSVKMNVMPKSLNICKIKKKSIDFNEEWVLFELNNPDPIISIKPDPTLSLITDKITINQATRVNIFGWFSFLYDEFMDFVEEILAFRSIFNIRPSIMQNRKL